MCAWDFASFFLHLISHVYAARLRSLFVCFVLHYWFVSTFVFFVFLLSFCLLLLFAM